MRGMSEALGSVQGEVRAEGGKCREWAEWCGCTGDERGPTVFLGSIQETTWPFKHWFDCLHLLSVLMRPEHSQAVLPALEITPLLQQFIPTATALQRME